MFSSSRVSSFEFAEKYSLRKKGGVLGFAAANRRIPRIVRTQRRTRPRMVRGGSGSTANRRMGFKFQVSGFRFQVSGFKLGVLGRLGESGISRSDPPTLLAIGGLRPRWGVLENLHRIGSKKSSPKNLSEKIGGSKILTNVYMRIYCIHVKTHNIYTCIQTTVLQRMANNEAR